MKRFLSIFLVVFMAAPAYAQTGADYDTLSEMAETITTSDFLFLFDASEADGSRMVKRSFDANETNCFNGAGGWSSFEPAGVQVGELTDTDVTAAELTAVADGDTSATATTLAGTDKIIINKAGTMMQVALTNMPTYIIGEIDTVLDNVTLTPTGGSWNLSEVDVTLSSDTTLAVTGPITGMTKSLTLTSAEGNHDGGNDAATLTDSGETWGTNTYVGIRVRNVPDGSTCVVTANDNTTMTCPLTGGTDNNWDTGDAWAVEPGPFQSGSIFYINAATTILHPATVGYSACYYSDGANVIKVDPQSASMEIFLNGATIGAGDELDSPGAAGDYICIQNRSATKANTLGRSGTWIDGGAS